MTFLALLRALLIPKAQPAVENLALRQRIAVLKRSVPRPRIRARDRIIWVLLRRLWSGWRGAVDFVQPATVVPWRQADATCQPLDESAECTTTARADTMSCQIVRIAGFCIDLYPAVSREDSCDAIRRSVQGAVRDLKGARARRRATRRAIWETLELYGLVTRTRGGRPLPAVEGENHA